ncbi:hypothetical protein OsJ_19928 [Oryza sativa Japonica Group]|uniref:Peptidase A1 domain-containing protein n=2 Tax=Oryza sativa TaxID=4530 RepID=A3B7V2_ORYSJ|nr:hypothetical protein OsJ_19928 [Oryza sativa Japonica Group]
MADMVDDDQRRADYIQKRLTGATDDKQPMAFSSRTSQYEKNGQYATNGGLGSVPHLKSLSTTATTNSAPDGTSAVTQTVIIDSGSDVSWVQCKPCPLPMCHRQRDPLFDPAMSTTYAAVPCTSAACAQLGPYRRGCSANAQCQFGINYGDGSTATGTYSFDDLTLGPYDVIRGFRFGCAHADRGSAFDYDVAGSLALGGGSQSLVQQTATRYGRVFSYCLPPTASSLGFLVLGVPPERAQLIPSFVSTPLLSSSMAPTFYRVLLRAIIVAGRPLAVPPAVFSASSVIDSSTIISRLPPTAYQALRAAFRSAMTMYRAAPPVSILDTCYDFTGVRSITLPSIALVFDGGATVNLDAAGILLGSCLAFAPTASDRMPGFIGNVQQKTLEGCSANAQCQFGINYGDGSTATGTYSFDDLTLGPYDVDRQGLPLRTATQYGRVFSYCIPPSPSSLGFITLGVPPQRAALVPTFVSTPLLSSSSMPPTFYRVLLRAIIVAGRPLPVPPTVFSTSSVIASTTVISRLPPTAYQALRAAFRRAMTMYRTAPPVSILDTCYDFTGVRSITLPSIALVFDGGATVNLDAAGILLQGCLAFAPTATDRMPGFIGNVQQRTLEVVYDVPGKAIRFRSAAC